MTLEEWSKLLFTSRFEEFPNFDVSALICTFCGSFVRTDRHEIHTEYHMHNGLTEEQRLTNE